MQTRNYFDPQTMKKLSPPTLPAFNKLPTSTPAVPVSHFEIPKPATPTMQPKPQTMKPAESGFSLVNFSKSKVIKGDSLYRKDFRFKTRNALKGTLKHYADRDAVANLLWDKRGYGGITKDEAKYGLRKLENSGKLSRDQVRAVRRKMGIY